MIGSSIGPYRVVGKLGHGGMGEVYRAHDTRLDRDVAVKVLPDAFATAADRIARFEREAKLLAALNHPHIAQIHAIEEGGGEGPAKAGHYFALVMELVEGPTLADRLASGPLPLDEALPIARQIADALEAAHEQGIIHRDLKPANIKVRPDGTVKVLDFGLAKLAGPAEAGHYVPGSDGDRGVRLQPDLSPTITSPAINTGAGTLLGTAAYMSPEQARGRPADRRADIWAFGCVLAEMLTGRAPFSGATVSDVLASILAREPELATLPVTLHPRIRELIDRCLEKDPKQRWQSAGDLRIELERILRAGRFHADAAARPAASRRPAWLWPAVIAGIAGAAAAGWALAPRATDAGARVERLTLRFPEGDVLERLDTPGIAISPDGTNVAYAVQRGSVTQLFLRPMDSIEVQLLAGTEEAVNPFFSPDGASIGFFSRGKLRKVSLASRQVQVVADAPYPRGGTWAEDGFIYFAPHNASGLTRVAASGGAATPVTTRNRAAGEISHRWPQILPGGKALLLSVWTGPGMDETRLDVQILATGERRTIARGADTGRYVRSGHIVYERAEALMAMAFDVETLQTTGEPVRLKENIRNGEEGAHYAVSDVGDLVYAAGNPARLEARLVWVDRAGKVEAIGVPHGNIANPALSPDGRRVAVNLSTNEDQIAIADLSRGTLTRLATGNGSSQAPVWTTDGRRILYRATRAGYRNLYWKAVDGTPPEQRLSSSDEMHTPTGASPDGKLVLYFEAHSVTAPDIWMMPLEGDRTPTPLVRTPQSERAAQFSRDGRWIAYETTESGRMEIVVQPFPPTGEQWTVSTSGGIEPLWSPVGNELFYRSGGAIMAVDIATTPRFSAGTPRKLFDDRYRISRNGTTGYSISPDGRRLLFAESLVPDTQIRELQVVQHWFHELTRLVPVK